MVDMPRPFIDGGLMFAVTGDDGAISLAGALCQNRTLRQLQLQGNAIAEPGGQAFAAALQHNQHITLLKLLPGNQDMPLKLGHLVQRLAQNNKG
jgi:hypothetical protein